MRTVSAPICKKNGHLDRFPQYVSLLTLTENQNLGKESEYDIDLVQMNIDYSKVSVINAMMIKTLMKRIKDLKEKMYQKI
ncbi:TPA: hypothetical protein N0F65_003944 [Lagenidium giganteum]|uniref:Uncharacterized protein n=1 Tax=Lagenidium giganteum TaxID=4803 RepID=A0AAV2ZD30_9STRA|nr:TPA: hypothetical protein N0F65_003944 [Lagenidium giganteum]